MFSEREIIDRNKNIEKRKSAQYREKEAKYRTEKSAKNKKNPNGDYKNKKYE